jgi:hypothetical protein
MLEVDSSGDYASSRASSRLALMTSSRRHLLSADVRLSDDDSDDDCDYATTVTRSSLLAGDMGSYEAFTKYDFRSNSQHDDSDDFLYGVAGGYSQFGKYSSYCVFVFNCQINSHAFTIAKLLWFSCF